MSKESQNPPEIDQIIDRPGETLDQGELWRVKDWLLSAQPFKRLNLFVFAGLRNYEVSPEETHDFVKRFLQKFLEDDVARDHEREPLPNIIKKYRPVEGKRFFEYLVDQITNYGRGLIHECVKQGYGKLGREWTQRERVRAQVWLWDKEQSTPLLHLAEKMIDGRERKKIAQDMWGEFSAKRLELVIRNFDPEKMLFWSYVKKCFARYCFRDGRWVLGKNGKNQSVKRQFNKHGRLWTQREIKQSKDWLTKKQQITQLLRLAFDYPGTDTREEEAKTLWEAFDRGRLEFVIRAFDPVKMQFLTYVKLCFMQFCQRFPAMVSTSVSLSNNVKTGVSNSVSLENNVPNSTILPDEAKPRMKTFGNTSDDLSDPWVNIPDQGIPLDEVISNQGFLEFVLHHVNQLNPKEREVIEMHFLERMTYTQIAETLNEREITVKQRCNRAILKLRKNSEISKWVSPKERASQKSSGEKNDENEKR